MKPVLITGATGFLGKYVVEQLLARGGQPLRLLCRGASKWDGAAGVEVVRGDVTSAVDVDRAVEGAGSVYHLAGLVSRDPKDNVRLYQTHVGGTRLVCEAALKHQVERVVVASSSGTIAVSREPVIHDERAAYKHDVLNSWAYYLSKIYAEKLAFRFYNEHKLPLVVVNPALLLGPGDDRGSSTGDIELFLEGQILSMPPGGMSFVDARDCAAGVIAAMDKGRIGERYLLGGVNWTFQRLIEVAGSITGIKPPMLSLPVSASLRMAPLLRKVMPLAGRKFDMDDATIAMSGLFWYCNSAKAERELGFNARDPVGTLRETVNDIRARRKR
jgi:dihydroflavonol-4-reductase